MNGEWTAEELHWFHLSVLAANQGRKLFGYATISQPEPGGIVKVLTSDNAVSDVRVNRPVWTGDYIWEDELTEAVEQGET